MHIEERRMRGPIDGRCRMIAILMGHCLWYSQWWRTRITIAAMELVIIPVLKRNRQNIEKSTSKVMKKFYL